MRVESIAPVPDMDDGLLSDEEVCIYLKGQVWQCNAQHEIAEKSGHSDCYEYPRPLPLC